MFYQFRIILRNLQRGGIYSVINIGGLAIGMAAAILILAWIYHEWSYDRFYAKEKNLYVVYNRATRDGTIQCWDFTSGILGPTLKAEHPEVARMTRVANSSYLYANGEAKFKIMTGCTDTDFLTMFDFPLLQGNRETALNDPYSVVLTEKAANRLFGDENAMGQTVLVDNQYPMTVTGVLKDLPNNTLFNELEALATTSFLKITGNLNELWTTNTLTTFVELHPDVRLDVVNEAIREITRRHTGQIERPEAFLYPLSKQHLYSKFENGVPIGGMIDILHLFGAVSGLILLIACINFMNLSTARSKKRAKEVGVRKVMGGKRLSLIGLFLGESIIVAFIAGALALMLALAALPLFKTLMGQQISLNLSNGWFWLTALGFILLTGLLAGSYPAFYLSSFLPVRVLKGLFKQKQGAVASRKVLVVVQFTVASALILSTLVVHRQIRYAQDRETGYNKDQLIYSMLDGDLGKNYELIKQDLLNKGVAVAVTKTHAPMSEAWAATTGVDWQGKDPNLTLTFDMYFSDADWTKTVGTTIIEGRDIDIHTYLTDSTAMLLNETAVQIMNLAHPVGEIIQTQNRDWHVVGVVKDFILRSPYDPVRPMLIGGPSGWFNTIHIKLNANNRMADNLAAVGQVFKQYNPQFPFEYKFIDEEYARKFRDEQKMGTMSTWFAGLTIFISCMGLFALIAYMAETRRKEIGIRKVLGASVTDVVMLLSKEFLMLVAVSILIASPVAWWAMEKWLTGYVYRTDIPWWLFVVVGCISLCIALFTVGFQAFRAAIANPVEAIKSE